jgi:hypothetical protein
MGADTSLKKCKKFMPILSTFLGPYTTLHKISPYNTAVQTEFSENRRCELHTSLNGINKISRYSLFLDVTQW